jgi:nucleotide-binding universal stress UspA family protein
LILICYDGSADARAAVEQAARLFRDEPATVLTVWEPFVEVVARSTAGFGLAPSLPDADRFDEAGRKQAEKTAADGAELAVKLGMTAVSRSYAQATTTARAILAEADAIGAQAIVMGSRGLTGVKSLLVGSVSHEVIQHADRTVVVVPSPDVAASRARDAHHQEVSAPSRKAASKS